MGAAGSRGEGRQVTWMVARGPGTGGRWRTLADAGGAEKRREARGVYGALRAARVPQAPALRAVAAESLLAGVEAHTTASILAKRVPSARPGR
jgi:hypothetical protein